MTPSNKPVFILGVGAQKAGTTWLCRQFMKHEAINMGFAKEYHIWDSVFIHNLNWPPAPVDGLEPASEGLRRVMRFHEGSYEVYFKGLTNETVRYTGDFTPSYASLTADNFADIKARLERAGFHVKVIFIMRDPAQRNWSAMRMIQRNGATFGTATTQEELLTRFGSFYKRKNMERRTRYDHTVTALRAVFDESDIFFGLYEAMFGPEFVAELSAFLGLSLNEIDVQERVNTHASISLPLTQYAMCKTYYAEVYEFCAQQFPMSATLWQHEEEG